MINEQEKEYIFKNAYAYDHDFNFYGKILGEPYLEEDVIVYFDGEILCIPFFPLNKKEEDIGNRIARIISKHKAKTVIYWGHSDLSDAKLAGYILTSADDFDNPYNVDMYVDLLPDVKIGKHAARDIKNAQKSKIVTEVGQITQFTESHTQLIEQFLSVHKVEFVSRRLIMGLKLLLPLDTTRLVEARVGERLVGFIVLDTFIPSMYIGLFGFFDRKVHGVTSSLYLKMIEYSKASGARVLNLGYAMNKGLYDYKKQWPVVASHPMGSNSWEKQ